MRLRRTGTDTAERTLRVLPSPADMPNIRVYPGPSAPSRALRIALQLTVRPVLQTWGAVPRLPWPYGVIDSAATPLPAIGGTKTQPVRLRGCGAQWMRPRTTSGRRALLYLHGGAFVCCGLHTHRRLLSEIAAVCRAPALSVGYRMLPEEPISLSIEDCLDGYAWLLAEGYRPEQIVIAGDSAGGFLALMTAITARERGLAYPAAVVCQSPLIDTDPGRKLEHLGEMRDPLFPANALISLTELMTRVERERGHLGEWGRIRSPLDVDLAGFPPVLVQAGAEELLSVDAEQIATHISESGADCRLELYEGQFHVFQAAADLIPEGRDAIDRIGRFVLEQVPD